MFKMAEEPEKMAVNMKRETDSRIAAANDFTPNHSFKFMGIKGLGMSRSEDGTQIEICPGFRNHRSETTTKKLESASISNGTADISKGENSCNIIQLERDSSRKLMASKFGEDPFGGKLNYMGSGSTEDLESMLTEKYNEILDIGGVEDKIQECESAKISLNPQAILECLDQLRDIITNSAKFKELDSEIQEKVLTAIGDWQTQTVNSYGLTSHHIIPDFLLHAFYVKVSAYLKDPKKTHNKEIGDAFTAWKGKAAVEEGEEKRAKLDGGDHSLSLCEWMYGNIFIGPDCRLRLDDMDDKFDVGSKTGNTDIDGQVENLERIYAVLQEIKDVNIEENEAEVASVLNALADVAMQNKTLHNPILRGQVAVPGQKAYDLANWVNVGLAVPESAYAGNASKFDQYPNEAESWWRLYALLDDLYGDTEIRDKVFERMESNVSCLITYKEMFEKFVNLDKIDRGAQKRPRFISKTNYRFVHTAFANAIDFQATVFGYKLEEEAIRIKAAQDKAAQEKKKKEEEEEETRKAMESQSGGMFDGLF